MTKDSNVACPVCGKPFESEVYRESGLSPLVKHVLAKKDDKHMQLREKIKSNN